MYPVSEQIRDATKVGVFFVKVKLIKGFRYKYKFVWREYETVDENWHIRVETDGTKNNFIEVQDDNMTVADFIQDQIGEGGAQTLDECTLTKIQSYKGDNVQAELKKKI